MLLFTTNEEASKFQSKVKTRLLGIVRKSNYKPLELYNNEEMKRINGKEVENDLFKMNFIESKVIRQSYIKA